MPATWKAYGVDANKDKLKDPYNPADAIFAAARYLKAAGAEQDLRKAIFAYNHADWYVDSVLMRARLIGGLPSNLVGSLTGLTQGHFPVAAKATYADDLSEAEAKKFGKRSRKAGNRALVVDGSKHRRGIKVFARRGAPVVAVNDGRIVRIGRSKRLGRFVQLQDVYGNTYTYARLAKVAKNFPAPKQRTTTRKQVARELELPAKDAKPTAPASATTVKASKRKAVKRSAAAEPQGRAQGDHVQAAPVRQPAAPARRARRRRAAAVRAHRQDRRQLDASRATSARSSASTARTSGSSGCARARASSPARSSAASGRPRARRPRTSCSRSGPPAAAPRASTRSRSSTAGSCSSRPPSTAPPARTRSSAPTPSSPRSARSCS